MMGNIIKRLVGWRDVFQFYLWASFLYNPSRKKQLEYLELEEKKRLKKSRGKFKQIFTNRKRTANPSARVRDHQEQADNQVDISHYDDNQNSSIYLTAQYNAGLLPPMSKLGLTYQIVSTAFNIYMFCQTMLVLLIDSSGKLPLTQYLNCYGPRYTIHPQIARTLVPVLTLVSTFDHLYWRYLIVVSEKKFDLNLIQFLMADERLLEERLRLGPAPEKLDILHRSLYCRMANRVSRRTEFKLRPNRDVSARNRIIQMIEMTYETFIVVTVGFAMFAMPVFIYTGLYHQHVLYEKCTLQVSSRGSAARTLLSFFVTFVFFVDSAIGICMIAMAGFIFAFDLLLYWKQIEARTRELYRTLLETKHKSDFDNQQQQQLVDAQPVSYPSHHLQVAANKWPAIDESTDHHHDALLDVMLTRRDVRDAKTTATDQTVAEVQSLLADFFAQLRNVDKFVSVLVPVALFVWLSCNFAVTVSKFQLDLNAQWQVIFIRATQVTGCGTIISLGVLVLYLKESTEMLYPTLCGILVTDSQGNKGYWLKILDVYSRKPTYAFTIFHGPIFTHATFIRVLSYTLTLVIILDSHSYRMLT